MSHIVSIKTRLTDAGAVAAACQRLALPQPVAGTAELYSGKAQGLLVHLPGWQYPAVIDTASGEVKFDNFNSHWGEESQLHKLLQAYAVEKARIEARRAGHTLTEQPLASGAIKLSIQVGAGSGGAV